MQPVMVNTTRSWESGALTGAGLLALVAVAFALEQFTGIGSRELRVLPTLALMVLVAAAVLLAGKMGRTGFVVLWGVLLIVWLLLSTGFFLNPRAFLSGRSGGAPGRFVQWSLFALPCWLGTLHHAHWPVRGKLGVSYLAWASVIVTSGWLASEAPDVGDSRFGAGAIGLNVFLVLWPYAASAIAIILSVRKARPENR